MRRLILMRHGEAENVLAGIDDRKRRLTAAGQAAAARCGQEIRSLGFSPEIILCSDAERAVATMHAVVRSAGLVGVATKIHADLYLADDHYVIQACGDEDDAMETILMIGHNPGWSEAATVLCGTPLSLGTAQAALLEHPADEWIAAINEIGRWKLKGIVP
jgi:phosphohistidine phosphatase